MRSEKIAQPITVSDQKSSIMINPFQDAIEILWYYHLFEELIWFKHIFLDF